ncbi:MAG: hypothetical protein U0641_05370 [Anaerolineae bacterium]
MSFNSYIWQLFKTSPAGRESIEMFANLFARLKSGHFNLSLGYVEGVLEDEDPEGAVEYIQGLLDDINWTSVADFNEAAQFFDGIMFTPPGEPEQSQKESSATNDEGAAAEVLSLMPLISIAFYTRYPDFFIPYFFRRQFYLLQQIFDEFGIPLPEVPKKNRIVDRIAYYMGLCQVLYEFRIANQLSPAELCAFLYTFAPNAVSWKQEGTLPKPARVWIVGGGIGGGAVNNADFDFVDEADQNSISHWNSNPDTERGDIIIMYCLSPRSYVHSIWRAMTHGFRDPFFYFYNTTWICEPTKTCSVTYEEMRRDSVLSQNGLVKSKMQGVNGRPFTFKEYQALLQIMKRKGQDLSVLPTLEIGLPPPDGDSPSIKNERDVEVNLVEPLLQLVGYSDKDWLRQMSLAMGSGEAVYPDYAFLPKTSRGEEQAPMVLEAKYRVTSDRALFAAYCQAKSYALRLQANIFVIASLEGLWIFPADKRAFDFKARVHTTWSELQDPDMFRSVRDRIGKSAISRRV